MGRARVGPDPDVYPNFKNQLRKTYYTRKEFNDSLITTARKINWVDGLEVQFADGSEYKLDLMGPSPEEIRQTCQDIKDQGLGLSLHLSKHLIDLFRPNPRTGKPFFGVSLNKFLREFNFNPIVGHYKEHEDIGRLYTLTEDYLLCGAKLEDKFQKRLVLENGFRANNTIRELAKESRKLCGICLDTGHVGRAFKEDPDDPYISSKDREASYAISTSLRSHIIADELPRFQGELDSLKQWTPKNDAERQQRKLGLQKMVRAINSAKKTLRFYDVRKKIGGDFFYFNSSRISDCGRNVRHVHAHWISYDSERKRWYDHYPFGYQGHKPTPLQHEILRQMLAAATNLQSYATELRKEFNTPQQLNNAHDTIEQYLT